MFVYFFEYVNKIRFSFRISGFKFLSKYICKIHQIHKCYFGFISDIDECASNTDNCSANANCTDIDGGFICTCETGFTGNGQTCTGTNIYLAFCKLDYKLLKMFVQA